MTDKILTMDDLSQIEDHYKDKHENPETSETAIKRMFEYENKYTDQRHDSYQQFVKNA